MKIKIGDDCGAGASAYCDEIEGKYIEMSEECKQNIDNVRKEISNMLSNY